MKWKNVLVTVVIVLLVVVLALLALELFEPHKEIKSRIKQYKLILTEQQLVTEIVKLKYEAAVIQAKVQPATQSAAPSE